MAVFTHHDSIGCPLEEVWSWHTRPGALTRLSPEWAQTVLQESWPPLAPGAKVRMRTSAPGTAGSVRVSFDCEHLRGPTERSFVDRMVRGPLSSWRHTHTFTCEDSSTRVDDRVEYELLPWRLGERAGLLEEFMRPALEATFRSRSQKLRADLDFQRRLSELGGGRRLNVLIGGASGLVGTQVAAMLLTGGHQVRRLVRRSVQRQDEVRWDPKAGRLEPQDVAWADVVVHLGGASIARRLSGSGKQIIRDSRLDSTRLIADVCENLPAAQRPESFVCASAIGCYGGQRGEELLDETSALGEGFLADVCRDWEAQAARVEALGIRRVSVRTGVVMTSLGGMLRIQLPLYLAGFGGPLGGGRNHLSWISLEDLTRIYARAVVDQELSGPLNAVAPEPVRQREFARALGHALHRPSVVPAPALGPTALLGKQATREFVMADQRVRPAALEARGHEFRLPVLADALAETLPPQSFGHRGRRRPRSA